MAIASAVLVAGWLGIATQAAVTGNADTLSLKQAELARMQAQLASMKAESTALKGEVSARAATLEQRQAFLSALLSGDRTDMAKLAAMLPRAPSDAPATIAALVAPLPAGKPRRNGRGAPTVAAAAATGDTLLEPFRQLEAKQLALVDQAAGAAEARLQGTEALLRRLGLDPQRFLRASNWSGSAVGGPYVPASAEPRFRSLYMSWRKLNDIQSAMVAIPAFMPARDYRFTSDFGVRYDPFNGGAAMHQGVDMAGAHGEPIYAAASGTVAKAGGASGYGNLVEINHGRGIETRYGHLSRILVKPGETVRQGQLIARMGSTGRSTGTHLHYEIRVDGRAVDPRPFLEASTYTLAAQADAMVGPPSDAADAADAPTVIAGGMSPIPTSLR